MKPSSPRFLRYVARFLAFFVVLGVLVPPRTSHAFLGIGDISFDPTNFVQNFFQATSQSTSTGLDIKDYLKEFALDPIAKELARKASEKMVKSIVRWANNGFEGDPFYVEDYTSLFENVLRRETIGVLTSLSESASPYARTTIRSVADKHNEKFSDRILFTLEDVVGDNWEDFVDGDFKEGGWGAWQTLMEPQNNPFGYFLLAVNETQSRTQQKEETTQVEVQSNQGFQAQRTCLRYFTAIDGSEQCAEWNVTTPGVTIKDQTSEALTTQKDTLVQTSEWGQIVSVALSQLVSGLTNVGLKKLQGAATDYVRSQTIGQNTIDVSEYLGEQTSEINSEGQFVFGGTDEIIDIGGTLNGYPEVVDDNGNVIAPREPGAIELIQEDVELLEEIINLLQNAPSTTMALDICLPGPDIGWKERMDDLFLTRTQKLQRDASEDNNRADEFQEKLEKLSSLMELFQQKVELANEIRFENNIPGARDMSFQVEQSAYLAGDQQTYIDKLRSKSSLLAVIENINDRFQSWSVTPPTDEERLRLIQEFKLVQTEIVQGITRSEVRLEHTKVVNNMNSLNELVAGCLDLRSQPAYDWTIGEEINLFCDSYFEAEDETYLVAAPQDTNFVEKKRYSGIDCDDIYRANLGDYSN